MAPPFPNPDTRDDEAAKPTARTGALIATTAPTPILAAIFPETLGTETLSPFMWGLCSVGAAVLLLLLADRYIGSRLGRTLHRRQWRFVASVSCLFMAGILTRLLDQAGDLPVEATYRTTVLAASHGKYPSVVLAPFGQDRGNRKVFQRDTSFGSVDVGTPIVVTETPGILGIGRRRYVVAPEPPAPTQTLSSTLKGILIQIGPSSWDASTTTTTCPRLPCPARRRRAAFKPVARPKAGSRTQRDPLRRCEGLRGAVHSSGEDPNHVGKGRPEHQRQWQPRQMRSPAAPSLASKARNNRYKLGGGER